MNVRRVIKFDTAIDNELYGNTIEGGTNGISLEAEAWPNKIYHNNISGAVNGIFSFVAAEISLEGEGNYWGRSCPGPLFIPGIDSNLEDVVDSFPYGLEDAWDLGLPPGCELPSDSDGDTILDEEDNCPDVWNPGQENVDGFGEGDACDVTPPDPPVITFPEGSIYDQEISIVEGSAEIRSFVAVYDGEDLIADGYADDSWSFSLTLATALSDGPHNLRAYSRDAADNISALSAIVSFAIYLYPPGPPVITKPVDGDITTSHFPEVSGSALPEQLISIYVDDVFAGSGFADAFGEFIVTPSFELADGEHAIKAQTMDGFGRISDFSDTVMITVYTVSEDEPIVGTKGKLAITDISDSPDPFQLGIESPAVKVDANVLATDGIGGSSPNHTFTSSYSLIMRNADTGEEMRALDESIDITDAEIIGGKVTLDHSLAWDGKDASGAYVPYGQLYTYDIDLQILKTHRNKKSKCGRAPCIIDEVHLERAGSIIAIEPQAVSRLLFVSNGQFQQELAILDHLQDINEAGDTDYFDIQVLPDYSITENLDLSRADFIIITEFSPNIPADGLLNIANSERPTLIVEFNNFKYSYELGLVTDPDSSFYASDKIEVAVHDHPVSYLLRDEEKVYHFPEDMYGIPLSSISEGTIPIIYDPSLENAILFSDDERKIVSTGIYNTTIFSIKGWIIFDLMINYLHPAGMRWENNLDEAIQALYDRGVWDFLSDVSHDPNNWTYESVTEAIWPELFRMELHFMLPEFDDLIPMILMPDWNMDAKTIDETGVIRAILYSKNGHEDECEIWYSELISTSDPYLPDDISYMGTEAGGIPLLGFQSDSNNMLHPLGPSAHFEINLSSIVHTEILGPSYVIPWHSFIYPPVDFDYMVLMSGSSTLLDKNELYSIEDTDYPFQWYWWGRHTNHVFPKEVKKRPFDLLDGKTYNIVLDVYKFPEGEPLGRGTHLCMARFNHLYEEEDLKHFNYAPALFDLPLDSDASIDCEYSGDRAAFDPVRYDDHYDGIDDGVPNTFIDAVEGTVDELPGMLPRIQLMQPTNPHVTVHHPVEYWCENNIDIFFGRYKCHFDIPQDVFDFNSSFPEIDDPVDQITPRHRDDAPWGADDDRGPWQKPHLTAGIDTTVSVLIRREQESLPPGILNAYCQRIEGYQNVAWLVYTDRDGITHDLEEDHPEVIASAHEGEILEGFEGQIVFMPCYKTLEDILGDDSYPYEDEARDFLHDGMNLDSDDKGVTYYSVDLGLEKYMSIKIPEDARGPARIVWKGKLFVRTMPPDDQIIIQNNTREFPVYIDPIDESIGTQALENSKPVCWIGATRKTITYPSNIDFRKNPPSVPSSTDFEARTGYEQVENWLWGGDLGTWLKMETSDGPRLYSLFGDIGINWDEPPPFDWFHFRGSGLAFFHYKEDGVPQYITGYGDEEGDFSCPVMLPELIEGGLPWEMVRADGFNSENGRSVNEEEKLIEECQESGSETVAATTAFQTSEQRDEGLGEAYVWLVNVNDWGTQGGYYKSVPETPAGYFNPWLLGASSYILAYDKDFPPYYSFMAKWDSGGIDDMGRSTRWEGTPETNEWSTFIANAVVAVDNLGAHLENIPDECPPAAGPGILVWHAGRYRASSVYLSYASERKVPPREHPDILYPETYCHFGGFDGDGDPQWTPDEQQAVPIIRDFVGELSALIADLGTKPYKVLYHITTYGQSGIVMREALKPWGPYSDKIPLFDCFAKQRQLDEEAEEIGEEAAHIIFPESGGACYGGFTHPELWDQSLSDGVVSNKIKFNVSMWAPYKVLLTQTSWTGE